MHHRTDHRRFEDARLRADGLSTGRARETDGRFRVLLKGVRVGTS